MDPYVDEPPPLALIVEHTTPWPLHNVKPGEPLAPPHIHMVQADDQACHDSDGPTIAVVPFVKTLNLLSPRPVVGPSESWHAGSLACTICEILWRELLHGPSIIAVSCSMVSANGKGSSTYGSKA